MELNVNKALTYSQLPNSLHTTNDNFLDLCCFFIHA